MKTIILAVAVAATFVIASTAQTPAPTAVAKAVVSTSDDNRKTERERRVNLILMSDGTVRWEPAK